ncbi:hypothetical protein CEXT_735271 [Caerostris extrusa]|uniref:Uncharacterized protein n=1 Tax=Caerostris extrusa TaxID=172846 RepID=A0AAV4SZZ6_CAEEX|nr:hypothetical protein CEXT_735271 [Caerostris extrusa]
MDLKISQILHCVRHSHPKAHYCDKSKVFLNDSFSCYGFTKLFIIDNIHCNNERAKNQKKRALSKFHAAVQNNKNLKTKYLYSFQDVLNDAKPKMSASSERARTRRCNKAELL